MKDFRIRTDLERAVIDGFALPLGLVPNSIAAPTQGYTVLFTRGEDDEPDTYSFHIVASFEVIRSLFGRMLDLLPDEVTGIVEIGSRDAYRSVDVYLGHEPIPLDEFRSVWDHYESFLLEDGSIAAGANGEEPYVEVFLDQQKGISVHVPLDMCDKVERILAGFDLHVVEKTWPSMEDEHDDSAFKVREVLDLADDFSPDVDELLLQLREAWNLELNVDPEANVDDAGRELGPTLWHALVIAERVDDPDGGAYVDVWATASSLAEMEELIEAAVDGSDEWRFSEVYTIDRVAFDERPDALADLPPKREEAAVHLVHYDPWPLPHELGEHEGHDGHDGHDRPERPDRPDRPGAPDRFGGHPGTPFGA